MAQLTLYKTINQDGEYSCGDIGITSDEWYDLLCDNGANQYLNTLMCFLREPNNTGSCTNVAIKYGKTANHYNAKIRHFSEWVEKKLNRFQVAGTDGSDTYWCIAMQKGWETKNGFVWQLRPELIKALRMFLMQQLINEYRKRDPFNGYKEEYKWQLLEKTDGQNYLEIIKSLQGQNIVDNPRVDSVFKKLLEEKTDDLSYYIKRLLDESPPLDERLANFKVKMKSTIPQDWKNSANDERTAAAILTCKYPEKYTFYKDEVYQIICQYFGINRRKAGRKFCHFVEIINTLSQKYGKEIQELMLPQIGKYNIKPLNLAVQTLFWCMKDYLNDSMKRNKRNYWLVGYSFGSNNSQFDRFIKESVWECWFSDDVKGDQSQLSLTQTIQTGDVLILKSACTKGTNHDIPFLRVKAVGIVKTDIELNKNDGKTFCSCKVSYCGLQDHDFDDSALSSFRKTIHYCNTDAKTQPIIDYANSILNLNNTENMECQKYITLLRSTHNLILTGAPGTGKTYLARQIAEAMGAEFDFVQFHPSYDYTDFVEGLRPIQDDNGNVGFERKDGVFKAFCKKALIKQTADSTITDKLNNNPIVWKVSLAKTGDNPIRKYCMDNGCIRIGWDEYGDVEDFSDYNGFTQGGKNVLNAFQNQMKLGDIIASCWSENEVDAIGIVTGDYEYNNSFPEYKRVRKVDWIVKGIKENIVAINNNKKFTLSTVYMSNITVEDALKIVTKHSTYTVNTPNRPFVFIIDEINRGEISKIFGELFFSIDPGYRGEKGRVQTQYQNIVEDGDIFKKGFFVPENVYIIGTMNDIDRSVESMDFAFRRRFAFKEIKADENVGMLDNLAQKDEAINRMKNLNAAIEKVDGLSSAYHIGASYFLKLKDYNGDFGKLWEYHLEGLLREYLRGMSDVEIKIADLKKAYENASA